MAAAADLVVRNAEVHTLTDPDRTAEAVAVRDGRVVAVGRDYDLDFVAGVGTEEVDLGGRVLLPGFVDARVDLLRVGRYERHADLRGADRAGVRERLGEEATDADGWVLGFGYDDSGWDDPLSAADLDGVADHPVAAVRKNADTAVVDSTGADRLDAPADGRLVGADAGPLWDVIEPDRGGAADLVCTAQRVAHRRGVTGVHDVVRHSAAPAAYRELDLADDLRLRVHLDYWSDHLNALREAGLRTNHGSEFVRVGAVKLSTDGNVGSHTARVREPDAGGRGERGVAPADLAARVAEADRAGYQVAAYATRDTAAGPALDAYEGTTGERHRVERAELATGEQVDRMAELGVVASVRPTVCCRTETDRLTRLSDRGVALAFGSDGAPFDPLVGVDSAANAPRESGRLTVTGALCAYTRGTAYAGFDEDRLGTVETGKRADLVALDESPWDADAVADIDVAMTVVDGDIVYRAD
jgi:predicted amidohydrolase YtcJ